MDDRCGGKRALCGGPRTTYTSCTTWITWMKFIYQGGQKLLLATKLWAFDFNFIGFFLDLAGWPLDLNCYTCSGLTFQLAQPPCNCVLASCPNNVDQLLEINQFHYRNTILLYLFWWGLLICPPYLLFTPTVCV